MKASTCRKCRALLETRESGHCWRCLAEELLRPELRLETTMECRDVIRRLGDYELLEEIARGGMGVVFRARQRSLKREVAVKVMQDSALARPEDVRRFHAEAAAAAKLKHPNIVAIYEVGEEVGEHYFSMDLIEGTNLAERTRAGPLPPREAAELVAKIAEAVQHAHEQDVLHRDLKPSNVLLNAEGKPFITDFGLTRPLDGDSSITATGQVLGTPGYMPPEQAIGKGTAGPASDIYSLGALLYHLLTGRAPFVGGTTVETLRHVVEQEPVSPMLLNPEVRQDLASVCVKCLAKEPARRYASARELTDDLRRFLQGEPTHARPTGRPEQLWRWCQRQPTLASVSLLAVAALLGIAFSLPAYRKAEHSRIKEAAQRVRAEGALAVAEKAGHAEREARQREAQERKIAENALSELRGVQYVNTLNLVERDVEARDFTRAENLLDDCPLELRGWEWRFLKHLCAATEEPLINGRIVARASDLSNVVFDNPGNRLVSLGRELHVFDPATGKILQKRAVKSGGMGRLAISPDGKSYAFTEHGSQNLMGNFETVDEHPITPNRLTDIAFSPDGKVIATCGRSEANVLDFKSGRELETIELSDSGFTSVAFSPDGKKIAVATGRFEDSNSLSDSTRFPKIVRVWETLGDLIHEFNEHKYAVWKLAFTPDSQRLVSVSGLYQANVPGEIKVWDLNSGKEVLQLSSHKSCMFALAISPDGKRIAAGGGALGERADGIYIWDATSGKMLFVLKGHTGSIYDVAFSPCGRYLASASADGTVRVWDATLQSEMPIDLSEYFNVPLRQSEGKWPNDDFSELPEGFQRFNGIRFNVHGLVQLGVLGNDQKFPVSIRGVRIGQRARKIHFLHGATQPLSPSDGDRIASYVFHYANGQEREWPIIEGKQMRASGYGALTNGVTDAVLAWSNTNPTSIRLYHSTWINPLPELELRDLDFAAVRPDAKPFLVAITVEE